MSRDFDGGATQWRERIAHERRGGSHRPVVQARSFLAHPESLQPLSSTLARASRDPSPQPPQQRQSNEQELTHEQQQWQREQQVRAEQSDAEERERVRQEQIAQQNRDLAAYLAEREQNRNQHSVASSPDASHTRQQVYERAFASAGVNGGQRGSGSSSQSNYLSPPPAQQQSRGMRASPSSTDTRYRGAQHLEPLQAPSPVRSLGHSASEPTFSPAHRKSFQGPTSQVSPGGLLPALSPPRIVQDAGVASPSGGRFGVQGAKSKYNSDGVWSNFEDHPRLRQQQEEARREALEQEQRRREQEQEEERAYQQQQLDAAADADAKDQERLRLEAEEAEQEYLRQHQQAEEYLDQQEQQHQQQQQYAQQYDQQYHHRQPSSSDFSDLSAASHDQSYPPPDDIHYAQSQYANANQHSVVSSTPPRAAVGGPLLPAVISPPQQSAATAFPSSNPYYVYSPSSPTVVTGPARSVHDRNRAQVADMQRHAHLLPVAGTPTLRRPSDALLPPASANVASDDILTHPGQTAADAWFGSVAHAHYDNKHPTWNGPSEPAADQPFLHETETASAFKSPMAMANARYRYAAPNEEYAARVQANLQHKLRGEAHQTPNRYFPTGHPAYQSSAAYTAQHEHHQAAAHSPAKLPALHQPQRH